MNKMINKKENKEKKEATTTKRIHYVNLNGKIHIVITYREKT